METAEKSVVRRFYEIVGSGRPEDLDEVCAPDLVGHAGAGSDLRELKGETASLLVAFPDLTLDLRHLVQEDDLISVWLTYAGTHQAEFAGVPASGRRVKFAAWDLMRVQDGRVVEITQYCDLFTILSQIGALPTAALA
ncbi:ester cyclase [Agromyces sp. ISL-38]|uniref:ester cyclase n=1 Tax=Agromyces sp. ISL-38 TaxID=2819107 RepID=UPI001BE8B1CC|nr:ester cyclase [Agromyces sp. ISL-38]MBT2499160.1 ester cyclase [Agromyces sp. ISL-38]MBT2518295.1 ester cyclase [Streptomyces sp. ISL-90]